MDTKANYPSLISVIMPAYNCERFVQKAVESILNQTYRNLELLIADDGSADRTRKIIDSFEDPRIKRFHNTANLGYLKTSNNLFAQTKGEFITFQDADDYSDIRRLEFMFNFINGKRELDACGSNFIRVTEKGEEIYCSSYLTQKEEILSDIPNTFNCCGAAIMVRRKVLETVGGYNEVFDRIGCEDYYWFYLICEKFSYANFREPLYFYRSNPNSISGDVDDRRKTYSYYIVTFLIDQRRRSGSDSLESGNKKELDAYINELDAQFREDPSLFYRGMASRAFEEGRTLRVFRYCIKAIRQEPFKLYNIRTLLYFTRKVILKAFS